MPRKNTTRKKSTKKTRTPAQKAATARMLAARAAARSDNGYVTKILPSGGVIYSPAPSGGSGFGVSSGKPGKRRTKRSAPKGGSGFGVVYSERKKTRKKARKSLRRNATGSSLAGQKNQQRVITAADIISGKSRLGNEVWTCVGPVRRGCGGGARLGRFTSKG